MRGPISPAWLFLIILAAVRATAAWTDSREGIPPSDYEGTEAVLTNQIRSVDDDSETHDIVRRADVEHVDFHEFEGDEDNGVDANPVMNNDDITTSSPVTESIRGATPGRPANTAPEADPESPMRPPVMDARARSKTRVESMKPPNEQWILGRGRKDKFNLISWLIDGCFRYSVKGSSIPKCQYRDKKEEPSEVQTFDGFLNNVFKTDLGAVDTPLLRRVPPVYDDGVYKPPIKNRVNPIRASDKLMNRTLNNCTDNPREPCGSRTGKTALLVFFGQQVVEEILDAQRPACPPEYFNIPIPEDHRYFTDSPRKHAIPLLRTRYAQSTGNSPNNPRQQLNEITPWFDGGLVYGTAKGWTDVLRSFPNGTVHKWGELASMDDQGYFPVQNTIRLPMANPPPPARHCTWTQKQETAKVKRFFVLGNPRGNENAMLLTFGVVLFRWHNHIARYLHDTRPKWSGERIFNEARKWVIATHQQLVYYDWLPEWLGEPLPEYTGYDAAVDPQIEQFFQTAAMRFGHTLVTPGIYMRDYACAGCSQVPFDGIRHDEHATYNISRDGAPNSNKSVRTCNIFWRPQEPMTMKINAASQCSAPISNKHFVDIDRLLMGMASQRAEREDNMIVEDLRGNVFGPLEFSRRDLMAINIQRGRDHGTPDYNTARESFGLPRICSVEDFLNLNGLNESFIDRKRVMQIREVVSRMELLHLEYYQGNNMSYRDPKSKSCWENIDVWTGGILETNLHRPGPLFRAIIQDQFKRIRSADRFWFENTQWKHPRFSHPQINRIRQLKIFDMLVSVTDMLEEDIQNNPFSLPTKEFMSSNAGTSSCTTVLQRSSCWKPQRNETGNIVAEEEQECYQLPQLDTEGNKVEPCTRPGTYDYFSGSEISFITTFIVLGISIICIGILAPYIASTQQATTTSDLIKLHKKVQRSFRSSGISGPLFTAREWQGYNEGYRSVVAVLSKTVMEIRSISGDVLRNIEVAGRDRLDFILTADGCHIVIKNPKEYDCVLNFDSHLLRASAVKAFTHAYENATKIHFTSAALKPTLSSVTTKASRIKKLEKFYRLLFSHGFAAFEPAGKKQQVDPALIKSVIQTELTRCEFAEALGMLPQSSFIQKMFEFIDGDKSGSISFREFLNLIIIFSSGEAETKTELLFKMYDSDGDGFLNQDEFKAMIRSLLEAVNADITDSDVDSLVASMSAAAKTNKNGEITLEAFQTVFASNKEVLGSAHIEIASSVVPQKAKVPGTPTQKSNRTTLIDLYGDYAAPKATEGPEGEPEAKIDVHVKAQRSTLARWFAQFRLQIFWLTLYTAVVIAIFAERAYYYSVEREHSGLRHIAGYGVTVTRGAASAMMFCYATLLLTMCRNTITKLRETFAHHFIPFDSLIAMHKYIAILAILFTLVHVVGHAINFYHISTQTADDLACLFRDFFRQTHILPKFHYWCFQTVTGITGVLLVIHAAFIYAFSTPYARQHAFQMFWTMHMTYPVFYILMLIHGSGRLVQAPIFANFLVGPLALFIVDKLITTSRKKVLIPVVKAKILPSNVTYLEFRRPAGFEYKSGQWVRIATKALNSNEFHPFTLSSAPHETNLTLHIRAVGPFTTNLRQLYERSQFRLPEIYLEGPYGEGHQDWWRYDVSVLVGGGIGVTPFASILKDVSHNMNFRNCKKIYFLWVTRTQKQFEWFVDIIREVEECKIISAHVFITQIHDKFDLRSALVYTCERHFQKVNNRSLFTGLKSVTHFGRPDFVSFLKGLRGIHKNVSKIGVFSCGTPAMVKDVDESCKLCNTDIDSSRVIFQHHYENF